MNLPESTHKASRKIDYLTSAFFALIGVIFVASGWSMTAIQGVSVTPVLLGVLLVAFGLVFFVLAAYWAVTEHRVVSSDGKTKLCYVWEK